MRAHWPHLPNANCRMGTGALLQWYYRLNGALWLFDLLVGDQQQAQGHVNVERARRCQIDAQGEFGRKLDRQVTNGVPRRMRST
jgi:hypothetical protein